MKRLIICTVLFIQTLHSMEVHQDKPSQPSQLMNHQEGPAARNAYRIHAWYMYFQSIKEEPLSQKNSTAQCLSELYLELSNPVYAHAAANNLGKLHPFFVHYEDVLIKYDKKRIEQELPKMGELYDEFMRGLIESIESIKILRNQIRKRSFSPINIESVFIDRAQTLSQSYDRLDKALGTPLFEKELLCEMSKNSFYVDFYNAPKKENLLDKALRGEYEESARLLIDHTQPDKLTIKCKDHWCPFMRAISYRQWALASLILDKVWMDALDHGDQSPLITLMHFLQVKALPAPEDHKNEYAGPQPKKPGLPELEYLKTFIIKLIEKMPHDDLTRRFKYFHTACADALKDIQLHMIEKILPENLNIPDYEGKTPLYLIAKSLRWSDENRAHEQWLVAARFAQKLPLKEALTVELKAIKNKDRDTNKVAMYDIMKTIVRTPKAVAIGDFLWLLKRKRAHSSS